MFKHLSLSCLLLVAFSSTAFAAAPKGEKVGKVEGVKDALRKTESCDAEGKWKDVSNGDNVRRLDCYKTGDGGSLTIVLKGDNNTLAIAENSLVSINDLVEDNGDGTFVIKPDIKKGYMTFNKKGKDNEVEFSTGTAAAAIRGTKGFIGGDGDKSMFAGLSDGELAVRDTVTGESLSLGVGETVLGRGGFAVLKLKSSGDSGFAKILNTLIADTTLSLEDLKAAAIKADAEYQESLASNAAKNALQVAEQAEDLTIPQIKYSSYDSLRCVANVMVSNMPNGSEARVSALMDGTPISEVAVKRNMPKRIALRSGVHEYEFVVENKAGHSSVKKTLGCYPMKPFSIKVFGKNPEILQIPPHPPETADVIMQTLRFQIRLPENDPSLLNKVTVRQDGKVILQERLSQIQNLDYQIPVELKRTHKNRFDIEVIHKSGYVVKTTKVYKDSK